MISKVILTVAATSILVAEGRLLSPEEVHHSDALLTINDVVAPRDTGYRGTAGDDRRLQQQQTPQCECGTLQQFQQGAQLLYPNILTAAQLEGEIGCQTAEIVACLDVGITGPSPDFSAFQAQIIDMAGNQFTTLPVGLPSTIGRLYYQENNLGARTNGGNFPDLSGYGSLSILKLDSNDIPGVLPTVDKFPASLKILDLESNSFQGPIPDYSTASSLTDIDFNDNMLTGNLPKANQLPSTLEDFRVENNQIKGELPNYSSLTALETFTIRGCQVEGEIDYTKLPTSIINADYSKNKFAGTMPPIAPLTKTLIEYIGLNECDLVGKMPKIGQLQSLKYFEMEKNFISGTIPPFPNTLQLFIANDNYLSGEVPQLPQAMQSIDVSNNFITGPNPSQFVNLPFANLRDNCIPPADDKVGCDDPEGQIPKAALNKAKSSGASTVATAMAPVFISTILAFML